MRAQQDLRYKQGLQELDLPIGVIHMVHILIIMDGMEIMDIPTVIHMDMVILDTMVDWLIMASLHICIILGLLIIGVYTLWVRRIGELCINHLSQLIQFTNT